MNIDERIKYLHRVYKIDISNPNTEDTNDNMLVIKIPKSPIVNRLEEDGIELNDRGNNIRFTYDQLQEKEDEELLNHNQTEDYYYIRLMYVGAGETVSLYLHIFSKSYSYEEDETIFLYRSHPDDFEIETTPYYEVDNLSINYLQENPDGSKEVRKAENKTINRDYPEDYYAVKKEYNQDNISNAEEIIEEEESEIYNVEETDGTNITLNVYAKQEFKVKIEQNDSYIQLTTGEMIYFNAINTIINNFCTNLSNITVNNQSYNKSDIIKLNFGDSYQIVENIGDRFLFDGWSNLSEVNFNGLSNVNNLGGICINLPKVLNPDLSPFSKITYIPDNFLNSAEHINLSYFPLATGIGANQHNKGNLKKLDLRNLQNLTSGQSFFFYNCPNLKEIWIDNKDWTKVNLNPYGNDTIFGGTTPNNSTCKLYAPSLQVGNNFKNAMYLNHLSNWTVVII